MTALATLRALATETRDAIHEVERHPDDPPTCYACKVCRCDFHLWPEGEPTNLCGACAYDCADKCAAALLLACDELERLRATLARMPLPTLTQFAAVSYAATRDPLVSRAWNDLTQTARDVIAGRVRYGLDYLAGGDGNGTIYSAGPGDPIPVVPPT